MEIDENQTTTMNKFLYESQNQSAQVLFEQLNQNLVKQFEMLQEERKKIIKENTLLDQKREAFEDIKDIMANVLKIQQNRVKLNVGGWKFVTSLDTLLMYPDSMLGNMFSGKFNIEKDEKGYFFIDRDGTHFRYILNFLRTGTLVFPDDPIILQELTIEAEFFQIKPLIDALKRGNGSSSEARFSNQLIHKNFEFSNSSQNSVIVGTKGTCRALVDCASVYCGSHYWEFRLDRLQNPNCVAIGVTRTTSDLSQYVGSTKDGWSIIVMSRENLKKWNSPLCEGYGKTGAVLREGDHVGIFLEFDENSGTGTLSYYINGINQGVAFTGLPPHLFGAISLHSKGDQITFIASTTEPPYEN